MGVFVEGQRSRKACVNNMSESPKLDWEKQSLLTLEAMKLGIHGKLS